MYTCWGSVRGGCGHAHRSVQAAFACCRRDQNGCRQQGGYSDRGIRRISHRSDMMRFDVQRGPGHLVPDPDEVN
jgi:hypothetical protein